MVTDHANGDFITLIFFPSLVDEGAFERRIDRCGYQIIIEIANKITHTDNVLCQSIPGNLESGRLMPDERPAKACKLVMYTPVAKPIWLCRRDFMMAGIKTFPTVIAIPKMIVPINNPAMRKYERIKMPNIITNILPRRICPVPKCLLNMATNGDINANINNGIVVSSPMIALETCTSAWISLIKEPTAVIGARKVAATHARATTNSKSLFFIRNSQLVVVSAFVIFIEFQLVVYG